MMNKVELVIRYRSTVGIACLVVVLWLATPTAVSILVGFFLIIIGMFFRGWSSGYINKDRELATDGPYALTRNPLYFGNLVLGSGIAVSGNNLYTYSIFIGYYLCFFSFLILLERKRLKKRFGRQYEEWAKRANLFFPKIKKVNKMGFNISFYMNNREYRVLYFSLLVVVILIVKYLKGIYLE
jgi:protein-S-isoprenylcysteine O-methyltransferase Ste14